MPYFFSESNEVSPQKVIIPEDTLADSIKEEEILEDAMSQENEVRKGT